MATSIDELSQAIELARQTIDKEKGAKYPYCGVTTACDPIDISIPLREFPDLTIAVEGEEGNQYIILESGGRRGRIPRQGNKFGVGAQCDPDEKGPRPAVLIVNLFPYDLDGYNHRHTDRGTCWVCAGDLAHVDLQLRNWLDPEITPEALVSFVKLAETRANEVIEKILAS